LALIGFVWMIFGSAAMAATAAAEAIGEVTFVQGVATAQRAGATPRFLQKGEPLFEGEVVNTGGQGYALIGFKDGTKFTLRPNTSFAIERYRQTAGSESAGFRLLKGGLRAVTGAMSKRDPKAVEINTATATIGIRGTRFDARLCEGAECAEEQKRSGNKIPTPKPDLIVARVALLTGTAQAITAGGQPRALSVGAALFNGDSVRTDKASHAVLAFRDRSKVTVIADSEFKLEDVRFTGARSESGNFAVRIIRGGVRALTGLLATNDPKAVTFGITTAVIGLRGTGFDSYVGQHCATPTLCALAAFNNTWQRVTELRAGDRVLPVEENQTGVFSPSTNLLTLLTSTPEFPDPRAPRPDQVDVDFETLFASRFEELPGTGLHVGMRDEGEIILQGPGGFIFLAGDEAGWLPAGQDVPLRITPNWAVIMNSNLPAPESFDERTTRVLELLNPGDVICEIR
jgi:hypothetical protein